ncbi:MAG: sigma-70 family RNA polymerase sigma factor [Candidatus Solibacter usitatus]|nr:sigma-70 family RNA polymerase sigma factor [Candidatus Solibacter usitatus]
MAGRILSGDAEAEEELALWFLPRLEAFASSRGCDFEDARDIAQETLIAAIRALRDGKVRAPDALAGFLYGTARNLVAGGIRGKARRRTVSMPEGFDPAAIPQDADREERYRVASQAIDALEAGDRAILTMVMVEGMKPGAIAERLGLTSEVVRQRKSRALKRAMELVTICRRTPLTGDGT